MLKKSLSAIMAFVMLLCAFSVSAGASSSDWDTYWESVKADNTQISLTPGADISKLNFNWHSETRLTIPKVRISKNEDMSDYAEFCGIITPAEKGEQTNRVSVSGLEEDTVYYYTYSLGKDNFSQPVKYHSPSSDSFKALYIGDIQCASDDDGYANTDAGNWNTLLNTALEYNDDISMIISCGDQTQNGDRKNQWAGTLAPKAMRSLPIATTVGNHDKKGYNYQFYVNNPNSYYGTTPNFVGRPYYFVYGNVLFISVNSNQYNVFDQYSLIEKAISENPDVKWRVIMMHHDIYGTGHHARSDESLLMQAAYSAMCDKFDIDVVLCGHEHLYGRSYFMYDNKPVDMDYTVNSAVNPEGTLYLTAASGSGKNRYYDDYIKNDAWVYFDYMTKDIIYSTVEFTEDTFTVKTVNLDNELIDSYTITKTVDTHEDIDTSENLLFDTNVIDRILRNFTGEYYLIFQVLYRIADVFKSVFGMFIG